MTLAGFWTVVKPYLLILWDGMGFFGFDDTKLARLRGVPLTFMSKFTSLRWTIMSGLSLIFSLYILINEGSKYDTVRT
jgi:hypothetical protein